MALVVFFVSLFRRLRVATFSEEVGRYRLPRYFKENGLVVPYSRKDAQGIKLLLVSETLGAARRGDTVFSYFSTVFVVTHRFGVPFWLFVSRAKNTEKGKFMSTDEYVFHLPMADSNQPDKEVLLVTNNRVIYLVKASDIFSDSIKVGAW